MTEKAYPDSDGRVFFDLARDRLATQLETIDAIDNKIAMLFSVSTALLGILGAVLALKAGALNAPEWIAAAISIATYLMVAGRSRLAYAAKEWCVGGDLVETWKMYEEKGEAADNELAWKVANRLRLDYEHNSRDAKRKLEDLSAIFPLLVTQSLSLVVALLLVAA